MSALQQFSRNTNEKLQDIDIFIGLEIHAQLSTESKMFCECPVQFGDEPNTNVCPVCLGYPGALPVANAQAVGYAYTIAKALECRLAEVVAFDRKNYFYPDLAKNYQISQFYHPVGMEGAFHFFHEEAWQSVAIIQAHLEEDAGKLIHSSDCTLCDYNRAGTPLMEVVTKPDIRSPAQAENVLRHFRRLVRYLGVCDGNMEEGSLRCDANISINHKGKGPGSKVEIKNINSFRFVRLALEHEIERQSELLAQGAAIAQETRLWNENRGITVPMRTKEHADDYRYFPDPDMLPLPVPQSVFDIVEEHSVELPHMRSQRMRRDYDISDEALEFLTDEKHIADFFEQTVARGASDKLVVAWCMSDVQKFLNRFKLEFGQTPLTPKRFAWMLASLESGAIHGKLAKQILEKIFEEDRDPEEIVKTDNLTALSAADLSAIVADCIAAQPDAVRQYKDGNKKLFGFFMGEIMKKTGGKANPGQLKELLQNLLG